MKVFVFLVLAVLSQFVWALQEEPPPEIVSQVSGLPKVHDDYCKVDSMNIKSVRCQLYYNHGEEKVWVILFDSKGRVSQILSFKDDEEIVEWCRFDVCT